MARLWSRVRRVWATVGALAFVVFTVWALLAYRATPGARAALQSGEGTTVERGDGYWLVRPGADGAGVGLLFFPGAQVEPAAYDSSPGTGPPRSAATRSSG